MKHTLKKLNRRRTSYFIFSIIDTIIIVMMTIAIPNMFMYMIALFVFSILLVIKNQEYREDLIGIIQDNIGTGEARILINNGEVPKHYIDVFKEAQYI